MVGAKLLISPLRPVLESEEDVRAFDPAFTSMASNFTPAQEDTPAISSNIPNGSTLVGYHLEGFTFSGRPGHA